MSSNDLSTLERKYKDALKEFTKATQKREKEAGAVGPITGRQTPVMSKALVKAMEEEHAAEQVYNAARDAYRAAGG